MKYLLLRVADFLGLTDKIVRRRIDAFLESHKTSARTLDVGGGSGPYKKYFPNRVCIDSEAGTGVDFVGDAHDLSRFRDGEFENILCTEVLEHLHTPQKALDEMRRVLAPGGTLILTTRFIFPLHNIPGDYFRFTRYGLAHLLRDWKTVEIKDEGTTMEAFAVLCERMGFQTETLWTKWLSIDWLISAKIIRWFSFLITKEYGEVGRQNETTNILTSGYYVVARK